MSSYPSPLIFLYSSPCLWAGIAQSAKRLATCSTVRGSNPGGWREFPHPSRPAPGPTQPPVQGYRVFPRGLSGRGVALTTHPPPSAKVKERVQLYLYSPSGPSWHFLG